MSHSPVPTVAMGMTADHTASNVSTAGPETDIDQYLRNVLRPGAFLTPPQRQEHFHTSLWNGQIDSNLPQISPATCVPWPVVVDTMLPEEQNPQQLPGTLSPPPDWQ